LAACPVIGRAGFAPFLIEQRRFAPRVRVEVFLLSLSSGCGGYTENESMPDSFNCAGVSTCRLAHLQARFEETAYDAAT
jgi:hypothetical protein